MPLQMEKLFNRINSRQRFWHLKPRGISSLPEEGTPHFPAFPAWMELLSGKSKPLEKFVRWPSETPWPSLPLQLERSPLAPFHGGKNCGNGSWRPWSTVPFWPPAGWFWSGRPKDGFWPCRKKAGRFYGNDASRVGRWGGRFSKETGFFSPQPANGPWLSSSNFKKTSSQNLISFESGGYAAGIF